MMNNLLQIAQLMKGRDPQSVVFNIVKNSYINDPMISQLITFAQKGDMDSLVNLASTFFDKRGLDLNSELSAFLSMMK